MKRFFAIFVSRLSLLMLVLCITSSFVACSSDDSDDSNETNNQNKRQQSVIGVWYREEMYSSGKFWEQYYISNDDCEYHNSAGRIGVFSIQIHDGYISYQGKWWYLENNKVVNLLNDNYVWNYYVNGDELYLDNKKFTRKKF